LGGLSNELQGGKRGGAAEQRAPPARGKGVSTIPNYSKKEEGNANKKKKKAYTGSV